VTCKGQGQHEQLIVLAAVNGLYDAGTGRGNMHCATALDVSLHASHLPREWGIGYARWLDAQSMWLLWRLGKIAQSMLPVCLGLHDPTVPD
jgi:hypothetical protein